MLRQVTLHAVHIKRPEAPDAAGGNPSLHTCTGSAPCKLYTMLSSNAPVCNMVGRMDI